MAVKDYSGFWIRFAASLIDGVIFLLAGLGIGRILGLFTDLNFWSILGYYFLIMTIVECTYESVLTKIYGGTLGKILLGIKVTDESGKDIGWGQSIGRYFAKYLSMMLLCIGFFMIGWDRRKQGLHDKIVDTTAINLKNPWRNRRLYVILVLIFVMLAGISYSIYDGINSAKFQSELEDKKIDLARPIPQIVQYCDEKEGSWRDKCYSYYASLAEVVDNSQVQDLIGLCNNVSEDYGHSTCLSLLAIEIKDPGICDNARSESLKKSCLDDVSLDDDLNDLFADQYNLDTYKKTLETGNFTLGYIKDDDCFENGNNVYTYRDSVCILSLNVAKFDSDKEDLGWVGTTVYLTNKKTKTKKLIVYDAFEDYMHIYLEDGIYDSYYTYFSTSDIAPGDYTLNFTIYDLIGRKYLSYSKDISIQRNPVYGNLSVSSYKFGIYLGNDECMGRKGPFKRYTYLCIQPTIKGMQPLLNEEYYYNMDVWVTDSNQNIVYEEKDASTFTGTGVELDGGIARDDVVSINTRDYSNGVYVFHVLITDFVSRKTAFIEQNFTVEDTDG